LLPEPSRATLTVNNGQQYCADGRGVIAPGGGIVGGGVYFDCAAVDTSGALVQMQVELQKLPATWMGVPNYISSFVASGTRPRTPATGSLPSGNYGWRYRVVNNAGVVGSWVPAGNPDFVIQDVTTFLNTTVASSLAVGPPQVYGVSPASIPALNGNQTITITGGSFQSGASLVFVFMRLSPAIEAPVEKQAPSRPAFMQAHLGLGPSAGNVARLAALFSLDAFAGGFIVQAFVAYWFATRFGVAASTIGAIFFGANILAGLRDRGAFEFWHRLRRWASLWRTQGWSRLGRAHRTGGYHRRPHSRVPGDRPPPATVRCDE